MSECKGHWRLVCDCGRLLRRCQCQDVECFDKTYTRSGGCQDCQEKDLVTQSAPQKLDGSTWLGRYDGATKVKR
jgi:hypothetical protein